MKKKQQVGQCALPIHKVYNVLQKNEKDKALDMLGSNPAPEDFKNVSKHFNTTIRNLQRWRTQGTYRKLGCGRKKLDPHAEQKLIDWAIDETQSTGKMITRNQLKDKAIELYNNEKFIASKGFLDKLMRQHQLKDKMIKTLSEASSINCSLKSHSQKLLKKNEDFKHEDK